MNGIGSGTAVAVREPSGALAIQSGQIEWDPMQLAALAQLGVKDASDGDKAVFLHQCQRTGLDPFSRQIYMIGRQEKKREQVNGRWEDVYSTKWTIQTGIEGWRVIRDRAERRNGCRGIKSRFTYYAPDGSAHPVWVRREPPVSCEMTYTLIEPGGREVPYTSVLRFDEYVQTKTIKQDGEDVTIRLAQWAVKPVHMLEKCTEADAYRCAFPQDFAGVALEDAMPWSDPDDVPEVQPERQRATAASVREHAAQRQQAPARQAEPVDAVIVDDPGWPDGTTAERPGPTTSGASSSAAPASESPTPTAPPSPSSPSGSETTPGDPRDQVLAALDGFGITTHADRAAMLTRLHPHGKTVTSVEDLTRPQAQWFADALAKIGSRDELEAAATAAEVSRGE